jgi:hypothetical protein
MRKVYVAGAYSADNVIDVLRNIGRGEEYAAKVFSMGFAPFTPWHDKSFVIANWRDNFNVDQFYRYSIEWLRCSDLLFVVPNADGMTNWKDSHGTLAEIDEAKKLKIPIVYSLKELAAFK